MSTRIAEFENTGRGGGSNSAFHGGIQSAAEGLCILSTDHRIVATNLAFRELLQLSEHLAEPGSPIEAVTRFCTDRGDFGEGDANQLSVE
ncbi:MAG: hypothetical protein DWQ09_15680 [Proteobacteria bacterium]|nr:MAG: hypothetical protein DWQ09_15680 [Pseudomonadota bacterium]QKK12356.1 MAG: hypothetical protein HND59_12985 [Pseudomonadota bacterium]